MNLLKRLADNRDPASLAVRLRRKRFELFTSLLATLPRPIRVLDAGGTEEFWRTMPVDASTGLAVTMVNLRRQATTLPWLESIAGDVTDLSMFSDNEFAVAFSNSVIEHLGSATAQQRMADEIRRVGRRYFVQTPNRFFPLEPHFLFPGFQFLPIEARTWMVSRFSVGWYPRIPDRAEARREVASIRLLTEREFSRMFPGARIHRERLLGLTKSFVAWGGWERGQEG